MSDSFIIPDWPAPAHIRAISSTRQGGFSLPPYEQLNLGNHVGDDPSVVNKNRDYLTAQAHLPGPPRWLNQVHGTDIIRSEQWQVNCNADAMFSQYKNHVCVVMTADCLPVLLCNKQGDRVAAIHAGWRGLHAGIIEKTVRQFACANTDIMAWLGPAIGPANFEVGHDVYQAFIRHNPIAVSAFTQVDDEHFIADIYLLARQRLQAVGVNALYGGDFCTVSDTARFFSYRRDNVTGRMASMIWIAAK